MCQAREAVVRNGMALQLVAAGTGGQGDPLLVHALGLGTHNQAEEVLVRHCGAFAGGRRRSTPLVIQTRALEKRTDMEVRGTGD